MKVVSELHTSLLVVAGVISLVCMVIIAEVEVLVTVAEVPVVTIAEVPVRGDHCRGAGAW